MQNTNFTKCSIFLLSSLQIHKIEVCLNLYYIFIKARNYIEKNTFVLLKAYLGINHCTNYYTSETIVHYRLSA
jgi:hypothetical protein